MYFKFLVEDCIPVILEKSWLINVSLQYLCNFIRHVNYHFKSQFRLGPETKSNYAAGVTNMT